ncbi:MAG TPA: glycine zipper 2TM domain-containing protein [Ramlibacter sp.]|jgi:outer membrane lipoprotein SlyB
MNKHIRVPALATGLIAAAMMAGCATSQYPMSSSYPTSTYPASSTPVAGMEYGRITNIEYLPAGTAPNSNRGVLGAVVGGVAGAILGNQVGGGSGRTAATVVGGVAGAAVGNNIARNSGGQTTAPGYRITLQTEQGAMRTYEVPGTGDLRVGDRVRVEGGVIYRG